MPTSPSRATPVRVAECPRCGQLFAIESEEGQVACPACDGEVAVDKLEVVELRVASPVDPAPRLAEAATPASAAAAPPTVAEWLLRKEGALPPAAAATPPVTPGDDAKRSLAESLGWRNEPANPGLAASSLDDRNPLADFRFDFGDTPLAETTATPVDSQSVALEIGGLSAEASPVAEPAFVAASRVAAKGSWSSMLSTVAGLLMIVLPGAYLALSWPGEGGSVETVAFGGEDTALGPEGEKANSVESPREGAAIVDPATRPASFDADADRGAPDREIDLPPTAPREVTVPPGGAATVSPTAPPVDDPFAAAPTGVAVGDRYATVAPAPEPAGFALSEDEPARITAPPAGGNASIEAPPASMPVGLVRAPRYGLEELRAALAPADDSLRGFSGGTLADPARAAEMGQHYARLCYLAQVLTLIESDPSQGDLLTAELQGLESFTRLFRSELARAASRQVASHWIGWTGRPHGGVFFAGVPEDLRAAGDVVQYRFDLGGSAVPVVMAKPIDVGRFVNTGARELGVVGVVVENPREWISGYDGEAERVVWARKTIPLAKPTEP